MSLRTSLFVSLAGAVLLAGCPRQPATVPGGPLPELVVVGTADRRAVVVVDGKIREVLGADTAGALIEAPLKITGDRVTAGFVDAHAHPLGLGRRLTSLDLVGTTSYAEVLERVGAEAEGTTWLVGRGWDQNDWSDAPPGGWPTAADLDALVGDRPVALSRVDGHAVWVSSAALAAAGIDDDTPDPEGGRIVRDGEGHAVGVLVDNAWDLLEMPPAPLGERERQLRLALDEIAANGLTGVHVMGMDDATVALYERLDAAGELPVRIWAYVSPASGAQARLATSGPWHGTRFSVVGVKAMVDGALGSRGAWLSEDYADEPGHRGAAMASTEDFAALTDTMLAGGAQVAVHAIGDAGVGRVLDAYAAARAAQPDAAAVRLRIEHAQVVRPEDVPRFAELGVVASMQPTHATSDMPWAADRLGPERLGWAYAWRSFLDAGVPLAFGSDFPVEEVGPGLGLWSAGHRGELPGTALSEDEAVAAFTTGAAYAVHAEDRFGKLAAGYEADLTVWRVEGERWLPVATIVGGEVVWQAEAD